MPDKIILFESFLSILVQSQFQQDLNSQV